MVGSHLPGASALGQRVFRGPLGSQPLSALCPHITQEVPGSRVLSPVCTQAWAEWLPSSQGLLAGADGQSWRQEPTVLSILLVLLTQGVLRNKRISSPPHTHTRKLTEGELRLALHGGIRSDFNSCYFPTSLFFPVPFNGHTQIFSSKINFWGSSPGGKAL